MAQRGRDIVDMVTDIICVIVFLIFLVLLSEKSNHIIDQNELILDQLKILDERSAEKLNRCMDIGNQIEAISSQALRDYIKRTCDGT